MPKISIFTPVTDPQYLEQAWASLQVQNYRDFEWVIVPNNDCPASVFQIWDGRGSGRIRVIPQAPKTTAIGALKRFACDNCRGDLFLELDADDQLVPDTLPRVAAAHAEGVGFIYSDSAIFEPDLSSWGYSTAYGWKHYKIASYGRNYTASACFPITPRSLCEIYYAPDHLRCWAREAYYKAGGHDSSLAVGDDHDLICRTYLTGMNFAHTGTCGYLYRQHSNNTVKARSAAIQAISAVNRQKYLWPLIAEYNRRNSQQVLEVTGHRFMQDMTEYKPASGTGWIKATDCLQFASGVDVVTFFNMAYWALVPGGYLTVTVPSRFGSYSHPEQQTQFTPNSFLYYTDRNYADQLRQRQFNGRFQLIQCVDYTDPVSQSTYIRADFLALHGQIAPGLQRI